MINKSIPTKISERSLININCNAGNAIILSNIETGNRLNDNLKLKIEI